MPVYEGHHSLPGAGIRSVVHQHNVAIANMLPNHRIAGNAQRHRPLGGLETDAPRVHRNATVSLLDPILRKPGWD